MASEWWRDVPNFKSRVQTPSVLALMAKVDVVQHSREDPARAILWAVAVVTLVAQLSTVLIAVPWYMAVPNILIVAPFCIYGITAAAAGSLKHGARSAFALAALWTWTGMLRLILIEGVGELLWVPMLLVGFAMALVYLNFGFRRRKADIERLAVE